MDHIGDHPPPGTIFCFFVLVLEGPLPPRSTAREITASTNMSSSKLVPKKKDKRRDKILKSLGMESKHMELQPILHKFGKKHGGQIKADWLFVSRLAVSAESFEKESSNISTNCYTTSYQTHEVNCNNFHSASHHPPLLAPQFSRQIAAAHCNNKPTASRSPSLKNRLPHGQSRHRFGYFYAFYEAQNFTLPTSQTPLLIWLQGGPGCSSLLGNFYELGPWRVAPSRGHNVEQVELKPNPGAWNCRFGLLFLDNPIGVGFSIAATCDEIPKDQTSVAKHLFVAISQFISLEPSFGSRPIYITGESYTGKYVPAIGYHIVKKNAEFPGSERINLAGVAIGNGLTDPAIQVATHAASAYFTGLVNEKQKAELEYVQLEAVKQVKDGNWSAATNARNKVLRLLQNMTGLATLYDFRRQVPYQTRLVTKFLQNEDVKVALGVNKSMVWGECNKVVRAALHEDVMKSVRFMVELLVKETKVLLFQGQCDLRDGVVSTEAWVREMKWDGLCQFTAAERRIWKVNDKLAGYVQNWGNLSHVVVLGAGHLVATDQAENSQGMIEDWVLEKGLFGSLVKNSSGSSKNSV